MRRGSTGRVVGAASLVLVVALGCHQSSRTISLQNSDSGRTILISIGDEVDVTLGTVGPGQYDTPALSSGSVRFLGMAFVGPPRPSGPTQLFQFEGATAGRTEVTITHSAEGPALLVVPPFTLVVDVH